MNTGKRTNVYYYLMGHSLFESNWYLLPYELQKYYILMIANAQLPINYKGMNVVDLNLERFTKVKFITWICTVFKSFVLSIESCSLRNIYIFIYIFVFLALSWHSRFWTQSSRIIWHSRPLSWVDASNFLQVQSYI